MAAGIGMKMSISIISKKFESVTDISTDTLAKWIKYRSMPFEPAGNNTITGNQSTSGSENVTGSSSEHQVNEFTNATRKLVLLDCRPEEEFVISHLKGSVRVDFDKDLIEIIKTLPQDLQPVENLGNTDIVCYCSIGYRSSTFADKFQKYMKANTASLRPSSEFPAVFNLEGSLFKWANESRHMVDIDGRTTTFAHPYNAMWGKLLNAELRKWTL